MGRLVPVDLEVGALEPSERRVVEALLTRTGDDWLILPTVPFVDRGREGEADVVVLAAGRGAVVIEVKGGRIAVREGRWYQEERALSRSPVEQARTAMHALLRKVRAIRGVDGVEHVSFTCAVAFPDAAAVPDGALGPDLTPEMVLTSTELAWPEEALGRLVHERKPVPPAALEATLRTLRPTVEFTDALGPQLVGLGRRLDTRTEDVLRTAEGLDANRRVWVEGPAGSGKSRLATRWARRASARGERVLLLCFNKPMAAVFERTFEDDPRVVAGGFHDVAIRLLRGAGVELPEVGGDDAQREFFEDVVPAALVAHRAALGPGFDTIILDEAQDFRSHWLSAVEGLLDPDGAGRLYRLGDPNQNVYRVVIDDAAGDGPDGWVRFPLLTNCRNTASIAQVAARVGGGDTFPGSPAGPPVRFCAVAGLKEVRKHVAREIALLRDTHRVPASSIAVITTRATLRDEILAGCDADVSFVRWEERDEGAVVCETAHRLKGTEWLAAIVASLEPTTTDWLAEILYVGVTRATTWLSVVAPRDTGALLGLDEPHVPR